MTDQDPGWLALEARKQAEAAAYKYLQEVIEGDEYSVETRLKAALEVLDRSEKKSDSPES